MPIMCSVVGCDRTDIVGRNLCSLHYSRFWRTGDPEKTLKYVRSNDHVKNMPEHHSWASAKQRCYNPRARQYKDYGGRGITMCERWLGPCGFKHFLEDMGEKPGSSYSLDRIDVDGPYSPENCRWATRWEQNGNRRWKNKSTGVNGVRKFDDRYWVAELIVRGESHLKYTKTFEEAIEWRRKFEKEFL